ncbi:hypothetical protein [Hymenobacter terricola]|uniref:hypothetical protein n=1 Tax=Hymenobacter terricola TaxID=2819236 RepID=UPI001B30535B|nr:hypothetical protein [Hymenobacter terricola]
MAIRKRSVTHLNGSRSISVPYIAPFAGLLFLLVFPFVLSGEMRRPATGVATDEQLPSSHAECCSDRGNFGAVIGLNDAGHLSFAMPESPGKWQAIVIARVAVRHGMTLTVAQVATLQELPYLATDIRALPQLLALTASERNRLLQSGSFSILTPAQFSECLAEARQLLKENNLPYYVGIKIDADASMRQVFSLTDLLQAQGINRFQLITQRQRWSEPDRLVYNRRTYTRQIENSL